MISVNIATHKKREPFLKATLESLLNCNTKADVINVYLNDYKPRKWMKSFDKTVFFHASPDGDLGAAAKFYHSEKQKEGVYLTLDDDLVVSPSFIGYMVDSAYAHPDSVVGLHGTNYGGYPVKSFYHGDRDIFYCYKGKGITSLVDNLGTGVIAFRAAMETKPVLKDFPEPRMTDPYMFYWAKKTQTKLVCLVRADGFVREQSGSQEHAIWKSAAHDDTKQTKVMNKVSQSELSKMRRTPLKSLKAYSWGGASLDWGMIKEVLKVWQNESSDLLVEFGSGLSTKVFSQLGQVTSFEHDKQWHKEGLTYLRPIKRGWYDLNKEDKQLIKEASVIIIDGPKGESGERYNVRHTLLPKTATIFIDDCHREKDLELAKTLADKLSKKMTLVKTESKRIAILK